MPYIPLGVGIQFFVMREAYIFTQANYRLAFSDHLDNHFFYSLGVAQRIGKSTPRPTPPPPVVAAPVDSDGDGIADNVDKCPNQKGIAKYNGCPIPDTDGDGINDEVDKCPNQKGVAKYDGCPIPDSDGDGVNDENDKCPNLAGPASNNGCPEVRAEVKQQLEVVARAIQFETGKAILTKKSENTLDGIISMMNEYPDYHLHIDGHTYNN